MFGKPKPFKHDAIIDTSRFVIEPKIDGFRVRFVSDEVGAVGAAFGRKRDYTHHFAGITLPAHGVFDAEVVVNGSLQETSKVLSRQATVAFDDMQIHVFDILNYLEMDRLMYTYTVRRALLELLDWPDALAQPIKSSTHLSLETSMAVADLAAPYIEEGYEGIVVKLRQGVYGEGWFKYKKQHSEDFWVFRIDEGAGEWCGTAGSLALWDPRMKKIAGNCSAGSDAHRELFTSWAGHRLNQRLYDWDVNPLIVEVEFQQRTADNQLRHPRLLRVRHDLM